MNQHGAKNDKQLNTDGYGEWPCFQAFCGFIGSGTLHETLTWQQVIDILSQMGFHLKAFGYALDLATTIYETKGNVKMIQQLTCLVLAHSVVRAHFFMVSKQASWDHNL